jgi:hypothetical protein
MSEQNPKIKRKNSVITYIAISSAIIIVVVMLMYPMVPVQHTVLITTTRSLQYSSSMFESYAPIGNYYPAVNVTNNDSVGGIFTVSIGTWSYDWSHAYMTAPEPPPKQYVETCTKSAFIDVGETKTFLSSEQGLINIGEHPYFVSAPSVQESHYESPTEYESVLNYLIGK